MSLLSLPDVAHDLCKIMSIVQYSANDQCHSRPGVEVVVVRFGELAVLQVCQYALAFCRSVNSYVVIELKCCIASADMYTKCETIKRTCTYTASKRDASRAGEIHSSGNGHCGAAVI